MLARIVGFARPAAIVFAIAFATTAFAQASFIGLNGGAMWNPDSRFPPIVCFGVQVGGNIAPNFALRVFGDVLPFGSDAPVVRVAVDALYTGELAAETSGYLGGGLGILIDTNPNSWIPVIPDVHLTGGVEYRIIDEVGVYAEAQLLYTSPLFRAGVNYHF